MILEHGPAYTRIAQAQPYEWNVVRDVCRYRIPGYFWSRAYKRGQWDGWSSTLKKLGKQWFMPSGLVPRLSKREELNHLEVRGRSKPKIDLEALSDLSSILEGVTLADYQVEAVQKLVLAGRGVLKSVPGSGKTEIMLATLKALGDPMALWIVPSKNLRKQTVDRYRKRLGPGAMAFKAGARVGSHTCHVACAQTLSRGWFLEQGDVYQVLIVDECLSPETIIWTPCRGRTEIGNLKPRDLVCTPNGPRRVKRVWSTQKEAVRYVMSTGGELIASPNHPVMCRSGPGGQGVSLDCVSIGEAGHLLLAPCVEPAAFLPEEWLLGFFLGDGHYSRGGIKFAYSKESDTVTGALTWAIQMSGMTCKTNVNSRGDTTVSIPAGQSRSFADRWRLTPGKKSRSVRVPLGLVQSYESILAGLFDAEAYYSRDRIIFDVCSEGLASDVSCMLRRLGIASQRYHIVRNNPNHGDLYRVAILKHQHVASTVQKVPTQIKKRDYLGGKYSFALAKTAHKDRIVTQESQGVAELIDIELEGPERRFYAGDGYLVHNCHMQSADTWFEVSMAVEAPWRFGCSATPFYRRDGTQRLIEAAVGPLVHEVPLEEAQDAGLVMEDIVVRFVKFETPRQRSFGDWPTAEDQGIVLCRARNEAVLKIVDKHFGRQPIMILVRRVNRPSHGDALCKRLSAQYGIGVPFISGRDSEQERARQQKRLESKAIPILVASDIYGQGQDIPAVGVLICAAGGKSERSTVQRLGRAIRAYEGKDRALIYDFWDVHDPMLYRHVRTRKRQYVQFGAKVEFLEADEL